LVDERADSKVERRVVK
jgi:hypothetical protein